MARTKRVLSLLLSLALGAALFAPAVAAEDAALDPHTPVITWLSSSKVLFVGNDLVLQVRASVGEGRLSYAWYDFDWKPESNATPVATGMYMSIPTSKDMVTPPATLNVNWKPVLGIAGSYEYCVVVTNTFYDADGTEQTVSVKSDLINVEILNKLGDALIGPWSFLGGIFGPPGWLATILCSPLILLANLGTLFMIPFISFIKRK